MWKPQEVTDKKFGYGKETEVENCGVTKEGQKNKKGSGGFLEI